MPVALVTLRIRLPTLHLMHFYILWGKLPVGLARLARAKGSRVLVGTGSAMVMLLREYLLNS